MSRRFILLLISSFVSIGFLYAFTRTVATSINLVQWQTDTDFNKGSLTLIEVIGTNDVAFIQLEEFDDQTFNIDYETASEYTVSSDSITVADGVLKLATLTGNTTTYPFTDSGNYTFNSSSVIVTGGVGRLRSAPFVVAQWHLNESSGDNVDDASDNNNDGTRFNMENADWVSGKLNNALRLDGVDEYVDMGDIASFERTDPFSIECWFNAPSDADDEFLVAREADTGGGSRGWVMMLQGSVGKAQFTLTSDPSNRIRARSTTTGLDDGTYHHFIVTYDGSSDISGLNIYVDGSSETLTDTVNTLSATTIQSTNTIIGARSGGTQILYSGDIDEVVIYSRELTLIEAIARFNAGNGSETTFFNTENPTLEPTGAFTYLTLLNEFDVTETLTLGTSISYIISDDTGTTFSFFNGSDWVTSDETFAQSNSSTTVDENISTFSSSGTFKFRAFLHADVSTGTPQIDLISVQTDVSFPTDDNFFADTKDSSQVVPSTQAVWLTLTITESLPALTTGTILLSNDGRSTWQTFDGSNWVVVIDSVTRTVGTGFTVAETNFSTFPNGDDTLDVRVFLKTDGNSSNPNVSNIQITNDSGFALSGNFETNEFSSGEIDILWQNLLVSSTTPPGTSIIYKGKAANTSTEIVLTTFTVISPSRFTNLEGQILQLRIEMIGVSTAPPTLDKIGVRYQTPRVPSIQAP